MSISTTALDRRSAVKIAAAASLLDAGGACIFMVDAAHAEDEGRAEGGRETGPYAGRVGFLVKPHNCLNCQACVEACRKFNKTPESRPARRHITKYEKDGEALFVSTSCMHCEEPACASVCPAGAIKKAEDGVVYVDKDRCPRCGESGCDCGKGGGQGHCCGGESHHSSNKGADCGHRCGRLGCGAGDYCDLPHWYDYRLLLWDFLLRGGLRHRADHADRCAE